VVQRSGSSSVTSPYGIAFRSVYLFFSLIPPFRDRGEYMHRRRLKTTILATGFLAVLAAGRVPAQNVNVAHTTLKAGDMAPDFTLLDNHWNPIRLSDFRGKRNVVLAFYVLAFTEG
jgi:AhpC/TSA family